MVEVVTASYEQILEEHQEIHRMTDELREYLDRPRPDVTDEAEAHLWAEGLSRRLVELHDKLSHHFREEETSGLFKELRRTFPRAASQTREIEGQHRTLMRELRAILPEALRFAEAREGAGPGLRRRTVGLLDQLNEHEAAENELIHRLHLEDIGLGD